MALSAVTPVEPAGCEDAVAQQTLGEDPSLAARINLTRPPDADNELIKVAALHGPPGLLAVLRSRRDYGWFAVLGLRAVEVCLGPRIPGSNLARLLEDVDPVAFSMQMLDMEMLDDIFMLMKDYMHLRDLQRAGLAIIELLVMDDTAWRDEVARKGGALLLCEIAKQRCDNPNLMCQVLTCMSYLAAEDYIEVMLCQHDALEYVAYVLREHVSNVELITRAILALLNLTVCEPHVEELVDKGALPVVLRVLDQHPSDVHIAIILGGVLANLSASEEARILLAEQGVFRRIQTMMKIDPDNSVLQVACLKALVNYSCEPDHYMKMEEIGIPDLVGQAMVDHGDDLAVKRYGNYFYGEHTRCSIL